MDHDRTSGRSSRELFAVSRPCPTVDVYKPPSEHEISIIESVLIRHPTVFESLLLQLPTLSIIRLYQTSSCLRSFIQHYPLAWNHLSFRAIGSGRAASRQTSPASDASRDITGGQSHLHHLDQLLHNVVRPFGTRITSLTLDHTAASGIALMQILNLRHETLAHLSVRGCKQVSLKYHIVPFLTMWHLQARNGHGQAWKYLALRSLYTFRCRHHRRRPYTPASLARRDSDSQPTHELIKICHTLGIWTDSSWCPTPGGRCLRRRDYSLGRGVPDARTEIWVIFDRLWRSDNRLGPSPAQEQHLFNDEQMSLKPDARLWESSESGFDGEPLGCVPKVGKGEGKTTPTHLRKSHKAFVDSIKCHDCKAPISERCEHCSIRMHCMGCRKTLCANCAFTRPLPTSISEKNIVESQKDAFWWAPGQERNPNLLMQELLPGASNGIIPNGVIPPPLATQWCCLKPQFSNGGGVTLVGPNMTQDVISYLKTAPLPQKFGFEDPEIMGLKQQSRRLDKCPKTSPAEILAWILHGSDSQNCNPCPRSLCGDCFGISGWKSACQACQEPFCFAHDLRGLTTRVCGLKDLIIEKRILEDLAHLENSTDSVSKTGTICDSSREESRLCQPVPSIEALSLLPSRQCSQLNDKDPPIRIDDVPGVLQKHLEGDFLTILQNHVSANEQGLPAPSTVLTWPNTISSELHLALEKQSSKPSPLLKFPIHDKIDQRKPLIDKYSQETSACSIFETGIESTAGCERLLDTSTTQCQDQIVDLESPEINEHIAEARPTASDYDAARVSMTIPGLRWTGCRAFMCPKFRSVGDHRPACAAAVQQCNLCKVHVCPDCLNVNPPCDCGYCKVVYRCPRCSPFFAHLCKKKEETALAAAKGLAMEQDKAAAQLEAERAGEFFVLAFGDDEDG